MQLLGRSNIMHSSREVAKHSASWTRFSRERLKSSVSGFSRRIFVIYSDLKLPVRDDATSWPVRILPRTSPPGPESGSSSTSSVRCASRRWTSIARLRLRSHPWVSVACTYVPAFGIFVCVLLFPFLMLFDCCTYYVCRVFAIFFAVTSAVACSSRCCSSLSIRHDIALI